MTSATLCFVMGAAAIGLLEQPGWIGEPLAVQTAGASSAVAVARPATTATTTGAIELALLGIAGLGAGLSAFASGLYDLSAWGPYAMVVMALLIAITGARPRELPGRSAIAVEGKRYSGRLTWCRVWPGRDPAGGYPRSLRPSG